MSVKKDEKTKKWYCRVSYKDKNGKYRTKSKFGFDTKKEAQVAESKIKLQAEQGIGFEENANTFANYFEKWCYTYKIGQYSKSTDIKYEREIRYVHQYFGLTLLEEITREMYQDYLNMRGKGNGKDTVDKVHSKLSGCLKLALADGLIKKDPTFNAVKRYDKKSSKRKKYMNYTDAEKLTNYLMQSDTLPDLMLLIALTTGLRIGEVYALKYDNITESTLTVKNGYDYNYTHDFTSCKNESSKRTIVITKQLYLAVQRHRLKHRKYNDQALFLNDKNRERITHTGLTKHYNQVLKKLNIPRVRIHDLRHTHASVLIFKGLDIMYISKRLGHANITETLKTYAHIIDEMQQSQEENISLVLNDLMAAK